MHFHHQKLGFFLRDLTLELLKFIICLELDKLYFKTDCNVIGKKKLA